ncbi:hypothetical protein EC991_005317 [Linnemannia zychae]|nr:hypothetical protein EC991_005317 [Linnemannia zychae]
MAALIRASSRARLSLITDGLTRLQLQCAGPSTVCRRATRPRTFSQTCSSLTTLDHDPTSSRQSTDNYNTSNLPTISRAPIPVQTNSEVRKIRSHRKGRLAPRWTDEEDKEILRLAKEGKESSEVYADHFQHRSYRSVANRMSFALIADRILRQHAEGKTQDRDEEDRAVTDAVLAAGESAPLRTLYMAIKVAKAEIRAASKSDDSVQQSAKARKYTLRHIEWTPEDDDLLKRLVRKHIDIPEPSIWHKVSGGTDNGSILLRTAQACVRRWRVLCPSPLTQNGRWTAEEELRLQKAVSEQLEGKYQVLVDVRAEGQPEQEKEKQLNRFKKRHMQQLPSQSGLPILKQGSRRLRMLNWVRIADQVQSRNHFDCREHFYVVYHNGNNGAWSEDEHNRLKEGVELFGDDHRKVAKHIGTRSIYQVTRMHSNKRIREKKRLEAKERKRADLAGGLTTPTNKSTNQTTMVDKDPPDTDTTAHHRNNTRVMTQTCPSYTSKLMKAAQEYKENVDLYILLH